MSEYTFPVTHKVVDGDTLSKLAYHYYGDGSEESWRKIYDANMDVIGDDPNMLHVDHQLTIPAP